jgi:hypothetical protein
MSQLAFTRRGRGAPIVLLHALGSSRHSFDPIIPALATQLRRHRHRPARIRRLQTPSGFGRAQPCRSGGGRRRAAGPTRRPVTTPGRKLPRRLGSARTGSQVPTCLGYPAGTGRTVARKHAVMRPSQSPSDEMAQPPRTSIPLPPRRFPSGTSRGSRPDPRPPYAHDPAASAIRDPFDG